jgi:decaprenyl-phosphate phosphoribosyltransferase
MRFKNILNLIRITHWSKNLYIFIPLFFSKELFRIDLIVLIYLFLIFSLAASCVYIFNDINDYKSDKKNKWKKNRPIANGSISIINANIIFFFLLFLLSAVLFVFNSKVLNYIILAYFVSNLLYTKVFKNIFPVNIIFLVFFYYLRMLVGSLYFGIEISNWLLIFILTSSLILIIGKKIIDQKYKKIKFPSKKTLLNLLVSVAMFQCFFYGIFCLDQETLSKYGENFIYSYFFVIVGTVRYIYIIKKIEITSDQIYLFLNDKILSATILIYLVYLYAIFNLFF